MSFIVERGGILKINENGLRKTTEAVLDRTVILAYDRFRPADEDVETPEFAYMTEEAVTEEQYRFTAQREMLEHKKVYREMLDSDSYRMLFHDLTDEQRFQAFLIACMHHFPTMTDERHMKVNAYSDWINQGGLIGEHAERYDVPRRMVRQLKTYMPRYIVDVLLAIGAEDIKAPSPHPPKAKLYSIETVRN